MQNICKIYNGNKGKWFYVLRKSVPETLSTTSTTGTTRRWRCAPSSGTQWRTAWANAVKVIIFFPPQMIVYFLRALCAAPMEDAPGPLQARVRPSAAQREHRRRREPRCCVAPLPGHALPRAVHPGQGSHRRVGIFSENSQKKRKINS